MEFWYKTNVVRHEVEEKKHTLHNETATAGCPGSLSDNSRSDENTKEISVYKERDVVWLA